jgi:molybdenum ABC transporter molybdate-binding protein
MQVRLSMGSTGNFARQIREGAPFEIFMAADEQFIADLHADGFTRDEGDLYAIGRIVIMAPHGSPLVPDPELDNLAEMLAEGQISRFAIANPEHAPYGMRAREALIAKGLWDDLQPFWCRARMSARPRSSRCRAMPRAASSPIRWRSPPRSARAAPIALIPEDWHAPLRQRMALLEGAGEVARSLLRLHEWSPRRARSWNATASCCPGRVTDGLDGALAVAAAGGLDGGDPAAGLGADGPVPRLSQFRGKGLVEALVMLPLVLPPTVFGFYLLVAFGRNSPIGHLWQEPVRQPACVQLSGAGGGLGHLQPALRHPARAARLRGDPAGGARGRRLLRDVAAAQRLCGSSCRWPGRAW